MNFGKIKMHHLKYSHLFNRFDCKPNVCMLLPFLLFSLAKGKQYRNDLIRSYEVNKLSSPPVGISNQNHPTIEILINSTAKDFKYLNAVINRAVLNSCNEIGKITIVVPEIELYNCKNLVLENIHIKKIEVKSEDSILNNKIVKKIRENFPGRYGWVLQQFLTIEHVVNSNYLGVLQVNSDTFILRPVLWIDSNGDQPLLVSSEYNPPYYRLLNKINSKFPVDTYSHITHHMLFQPKILKVIMEKSNLTSVEQLLDEVIKNYDHKAISPVCVEFELYALGLLAYFPEKAIISKFGNISLNPQPNLTNVEFESIINILSKKYNSISIHSYL
jgi:hypothetical protein